MNGTTQGLACQYTGVWWSMNNRLNKSDWIRHGLHTLASDGPNSLKVGPMAEKLKVSRGSFYWHFRDIADFRLQLLQGWQESSTDRIIQDLDARQGQPGLLRQFAQEAFRGRRKLDRAMRSWAAEDPVVAAVVASVDARRISRVAKLLVEAGVESERALHRAAFLYWAWLGQAAVMDARHASMPAAALDDIADLFEAPPATAKRGRA
jgi:AcrR family transcriptional regulator